MKLQLSGTIYNSLTVHIMNISNPVRLAGVLLVEAVTSFTGGGPEKIKENGRMCLIYTYGSEQIRTYYMNMYTLQSIIMEE